VRACVCVLCNDLGARDKEEAAGEQQSLHGGLHVTELDSVQVENALTVRQDQRVQRKDLKHLQRRHQSASALLYDVTYCNNKTLQFQHSDYSYQYYCIIIKRKWLTMFMLVSCGDQADGSYNDCSYSAYWCTKSTAAKLQNTSAT